MSELEPLSRPGPSLSSAHTGGGYQTFSLGRPGFGPDGGARALGGGAWERRRGLRVIARTMMVVGVLVLVDAAVTMVWQEPFTALYAHLQQNRLHQTLARVQRAAPTPAERRVLERLSGEASRIQYLAGQLDEHTENGQPVGLIRIPEIGVNYVFVKGTGTSELQSGPGTYPGTRFPGIPGTTSIAGHRTTFLAPFHNINELRRGRHIYIDMPYARFTYTVSGERSVYPSDVRAATAEVGYSRLVLSACTPLFSAEKRLLVYARLTRTVAKAEIWSAAPERVHLSTDTNTVAPGAGP